MNELQGNETSRAAIQELRKDLQYGGFQSSILSFLVVFFFILESLTSAPARKKKTFLVLFTSKNCNLAVVHCKQ